MSERDVIREMVEQMVVEIAKKEFEKLPEEQKLKVLQHKSLLEQANAMQEEALNTDKKTLAVMLFDTVNYDKNIMEIVEKAEIEL